MLPPHTHVALTTLEHFTPPNKLFPPRPSLGVIRAAFRKEINLGSETAARDSTSVHVTAELA
jgi:hypothetical protein